LRTAKPKVVPNGRSIFTGFFLTHLIAHTNRSYMYKVPFF